MKFEVTSGYRDSGEQSGMFADCKKAITPFGFPVKAPGCSQHEYGLAVDVWADLNVNAPVPQMPAGILFRSAFCFLFPDHPECASGVPVQSQVVAQRRLGALGQSVGFQWSEGDPVHFGAFAASTFNSHMRNLGFDCSTCRFPSGRPF